MNLLNVRKGQFVYYNNELHKVYSVKPFFKKSVHLVRLVDLSQDLVTAREIELYKPKHLDSFVANKMRYTLDKDKQAKIGDYILVINPKPDSLDHHHLHAIEMVTAIETNGIISNKGNGIRHREYWVMVPGFIEDATKIDLKEPDLNAPADILNDQYEANILESSGPHIGDVYQKNNSDPLIQAMVIAKTGQTIYLGGDLKVKKSDLINSDKWSFVINIME